MASRLLALVAASLLVSACARLQTAGKPPSKLPPMRLAADAVALDVAFVRLPAIDSESYDAIWQQADEQHFPVELRQTLAANGLRVGLVGQDLPAKLRELIDAKQNLWDQDNAAAALKEAEQGGSKQHLRVRSGRRSQIYASQTYPSLAALIRENDDVRGYQLEQARCLWALKPYPRGDGSVKLDLTPEIEHGDEKSRFTAADGQFLTQVGPDRLVLDRLRIEATLQPGQWVILSTTPDLKGLGEHFFVDRTSGAVRRAFILVRLGQTQLDDLFAPEQTSAPLATPGG
jgi:hypothetical protein